MSPCIKHNQTIQDFWQRRSNLNPKEWAEFRRLLHWCLSSSHKIKALHRNLLGNEPLENYIDAFIAERVFMPVALAPNKDHYLLHANALVGFFYNYLLDELPRPGRVTMEPAIEVEISLSSITPQLRKPIAHQDDKADNFYLNESSEDSLIETPASIAVSDDKTVFKHSATTDFAKVPRIHIAIPEPEDLIELLSATFAEQIRLSAETWLHQQESWVTVYLSEHICQETNEQVSLNQLAKRYAIANYHNRARRLGITGTKGQPLITNGFQDTLLGRWLINLGINLLPEEASTVLASLKILCAVALKFKGATNAV